MTAKIPSEIITYLVISDSLNTLFLRIGMNILPTSTAIKIVVVILDRLYPGLLQ